MADTSFLRARPLDMTLAGERIRASAVEAITDLLDGAEPLAVKLRRAVADEHVIVPLTLDDRARLLEVLDVPPLGLGALRLRLLQQAQSQTP